MLAYADGLVQLMGTLLTCCYKACWVAMNLVKKQGRQWCYSPAVFCVASGCAHCLTQPPSTAAATALP